MPGNFFDSNVLLYTASADMTKADRVEQLIIAGGTISVQVLNEITNVARRKMDYSWPRTRLLLGRLRELLLVIPVTVAIHEAGVALAQRYRFALYDAMVVAAAIDCGCDRLWSEDMRDGLVVDGRLAITNPFRTSPFHG